MSDFNPDVEFLGVKVAAGKTYALTDRVPEDDQIGITHRSHITNVALGPDPKPGRHTVFAQGNGMKAVVGTLEMGRCEQFQVDFVARDIVFSHTGKSDVYLTGYNTTSSAYFDDMSEEDDDDEDEDDDADVPQGIPLQQSQLMPSRKALAKQQALIDGEVAEEDDEEDDEDDESDDDEEEDSDDSDDEEDEARKQQGITYLKKTLTAEPINGKEFSDMDDDDMEDDEEDDDEDDDEEDEENGILGLGDSDDDSSDDEEESEDEAALAQVQALLAAGGKRSKAPAVTPQPAKKAKVTPAAAPATAPAGKAPPASTASQPGVTGPAAAQWISALKAYLTQSGGETEMSKLGGVKKPEGVAKGQKLKAFILQNPKTFALEGNTVTLKK